MKRSLTLFLLGALLATTACGPAPLQEPAPPHEAPERDYTVIEPIDRNLLGYDFWRHWTDGNGEVDTYDFTYPRYGQLRQGVAIAIFVTEDFTNQQRVKADRGPQGRTDLFPVMKMNLIEDFPTGVYNYSEMISTFVALAGVNGLPPATPTKVSFSSREWCGHIYHQYLFGPAKIRSTLHSYFDGEADRQTEFDLPEGAVSEDALWHWARGFGQPLMEPGDTAEVALLPSVQRLHHEHKPLEWTKAKLTRGDRTQILVPAGKFDVEVVVVEIEGGPTRTFYVETSLPRRIVRWETSMGERAEMVASQRIKYWEMQGPSAASLRELGLQPRPPRTP